MKPDRVTKLYDSLNNKELAVMAFHYLVDGNDMEFERVASAVQWDSYRCADMEYRLWLDGLMHMASFWAIEYWQAHCWRIASMSGSQLAETMGRSEEARAFATAHELWESRLLALDRALEAVCAEHRIDASAVRKQAGAEPFTPGRAGLAADPEYQTAMQESLFGVVTGWQRARCV